MTQNLEFQTYLPVADGLPPSPRVLPRLLGLLSDPNNEIAQMIDLLSFDPGLTAKLLRVCNSAYLGLPEPIVNVGEAINRLGLNFVYKLAAAACSASTFQSSRRKELVSDLWQHSVTSAFAAEMLAADLGLDSATLFTAALLHDIGKMVLAERWQEEYWRLIEHTRDAPLRLVEGEQALFCVSHGELGGRVLAHWKFPSPIASSVWQHHAPVVGMPFERETACVTLAEAMADRAFRSHSLLTPGQRTALGVFQLGPDDLNPYICRTQENFQFVNAVCQIGL